jgi:hypothetical protein
MMVVSQGKGSKPAQGIGIASAESAAAARRSASTAFLLLDNALGFLIE